MAYLNESQSNKLEAFLLIGCGGFETSDGFLICNSTTTPLLDLEQIKDDRYDKTIEFLDRTCKLFDGPTYDYNKSVNIITMLYRTCEVISEERLIGIQRYLKLHKDCGIFLILLTKEDYYGRQR